MNNKVMFNIGYGLYVVTAKKGDKDNGCIINTTIQVTTTPNRISVTVNKNNLTHDMIKETGEFNVSILTTGSKFETYKHFGFQSGRDVDKFKDYDKAKRAENGIYYITEETNGYISGKVVESVDLGTHTMFIADVTAGEVLSSEPSVTYSYYHENIKPKPQAEEAPSENGKKKYRCVICGYVYEGDELPEDYVCPICKHGAADFELI